MPKTAKRGVLQTIHKLIVAAAKQYKVQPFDVTSTQFWSVADGKVDEWSVRKLGGLTNIRGLEFPAPTERREQNAVIPRGSSPKIPRYKPPRLENFMVHKTQMRELFKAAQLKDTDVFRMVVQPDTHVPEHDPVAIQVFCDFLADYQPNGLVNLGDFMEMGSVSHWEPRDAKPRRFVPEVKAARAVLQQIDEAAGPRCIFKRFLIGNHEDWLDQLLSLKIPEVYDGIEELGFPMRVQDFLSLKDFGYRVVPINEILQVGDLHFIHGYYTNLHHAKKHLDIFGVNMMYGHLHDVQSHSGVSVRGVHQATSIGCLRSLNAPFMKGKPNNWSHAFGIVEFRLDGSFTQYVPVIVDGRMTFNGKVYDGKRPTS